MESEWTRRLLLRLLIGGLGVGLFPFRALAEDAPTSAGSIDPLRGTLGALLPNLQSAIAIGLQGVATGVVEGDIESLLVALEIQRPIQVAFDEEIRLLRQRLQAHCRDDFRNGRSVELGGWILSKTEVRLAALIALSTKR